MFHYVVYLLSCTLFATTMGKDGISASHQWKSNNTATIDVVYALAPSDAIIKNSIYFSVDAPEFSVADWKSERPATLVYDASHTSQMLGYTDTGTFTVEVIAQKGQEPRRDVQLFMHYQLKNSDEPQEFTYTIPGEKVSETIADPLNAPISADTKKTCNPPAKTAIQGTFQKVCDWFSCKFIAAKTFISDLVEKTSSPWLRALFVFLLGILMSLTPCIYPMIPITVGILQTTAGTSLMRNFMLAGSYTLGIAVTFATLGLLAATGSAQFGALLGNPYFVWSFVIFLAYLAFSMLGFYDMYVPRFMQPSGDHAVNGSFTAAFLFGVISGSVASPCLSPGLFLLLTIVATLGSKLLGFMYLFLFGLGLGTPLLIIGTFSNSLNVVPRAGLWMIEVKKLFGLLLLSMCFYYLSAILSWSMLLWMMGGTLLACGILYIITIESYHSFGMRWFKQIFGAFLLLAGCFVMYQALKENLDPSNSTSLFNHATDYATARAQAIEENKILLVDFGASWCISCKEIEHKFLHNILVNEQLNNVIIVKIDCTNTSAEPCATIQKQFNVTGYPTLILVEPCDEKVIAQWKGEILDLTPEQFIAQVQH